MWKSLKKLDCILEPRDFKILALLLIPMVIVAVLEVLGIFSILPFMQIVADPEAANNEKVRWLTSKFEFSSRNSMLVWMGCGVLVIYGLTGICNVLSGWLMQKVVWGIAHRISMSLLNRYTRLPYEFFLNTNSAELVKKLIADISALVTSVLMVGCRFVSNAIRAVSILVFLLFINYKLAILAFVVYGGVYLLIHAIRHRYLEKLGQQRQSAISSRLKSFSETMSGIKSLRVSGTVPWFVKRFEGASKTFCGIQPEFQLYTLIPKSLVEFLAFGGIIVIVLYYLLSGQELNAVIPVLSLFAMATFKLLPALSMAFSQVAVISHNLPVIDEVYEDMQISDGLLKPLAELESAEPISFETDFSLENVAYQFEATGVPVLQDISLQIQKGQKCAFVGTTGCGKSTLIDVLVGLLTPTAGNVKVDSTPLSNDNVYGWQKRIAYVPQDVFLFDDSIAANIALGFSGDAIDQERLERAARLAQVDEFVKSEFREGYDTIVGEKGVRLSGGQRQRIGLARVFYRQPDVLFLDEATSALDSITEDAIVSAIEKEMPDVTVVMVAHRLTSTRFCDRIFLMEEGRIIDHGSFDQLLQSSTKFRQMVEITD